MSRPSLRPVIENVVRRRLAAGEPLDIRSIQAESGGSASTVIEVKRKLLLPLRPAPERQQTLVPKPAAEAPSHEDSVPSIDKDNIRRIVREAVTEVIGEAITEMKDESVREVRGAMAYSMDKLDHAYAKLMEMAEQMRYVTQRLRLVEPGARPAPAPTQAGQDSPSREQRLIQENAKLIRQRDRMLRALTDAGVDFDPDKVE